ELLKSIGVEPAHRDRPGIYGFESEAELPLEARTTFDILVPEAYAGGGRRAARIPEQKNAASRALGLELTLWDRHPVVLATVDEPIDKAEVSVAGPAALLVAKAHKVHERLGQVATRPDRLRPKDSGDIALLMMVSDPEEVLEIMKRNIRLHPEIEDVVQSAAGWLIEMYAKSQSSTTARRQAAEGLAARFDGAEVFDAIDRWLDKFSWD
ncbi:MAG: hypothetical protein FWD72_05505, partial [Eggerthellaceae bacterium]|nr:hypothetical protein [Eggerthellaceae bacterium]